MKKTALIISAFCLLAAFLTPAVVVRAAPDSGNNTSDLSMDWFSIDGGSSRSTDGTFTLTGVIGQVDAAASSDGILYLSGGSSFNRNSEKS